MRIITPQMERSLRRFILFDQATCITAVAVILSVHAGVRRSGYLVLLAAMVAFAATLMGLGRRSAAAGDVRTAVVWVAAANWSVSLGATAVAPFCLPITVVSAMLPSILAVPYVGVRELWGISAGSMLVSLAVTALGTGQDFSGLTRELPPSVPPVVILVFVPFVTGLVVMVSAQNSAGLRRALADALEVNRRLWASESELRESRARVVTATDKERRRIARDLHDGAQQRLISVAWGLQRARRQLFDGCREPDSALEALIDDVQASIAELRSLAHGLHPPVLSDRGLGEALAEVIARAPGRCRLEASGLRRFTPEVETAVYWCCVEAVQNFSKHAGPGASLVLRVARAGDHGLMFEVEDDGVGFDPAAVARGQGLMNMCDRVSAVGGQLTLSSEPGRGVLVHGFIRQAMPPSSPVETVVSGDRAAAGRSS